MTVAPASVPAPASAPAGTPAPQAIPAADNPRPVAPKPTAVTSEFGWRSDPITGRSTFHRGVDLRAAYGQDVQATGHGQVVFSGVQGGYGNTVVIQHGDGTRTRFAHLSVNLVPEGAQVAPGQLIGRVGSSGRSTGPHLHFEVTAADGTPLDPRSAANLGI